MATKTAWKTGLTGHIDIVCVMYNTCLQLEITRSRSNLPILQQVNQFGALTQHITKLLEELITE